MLASCRSTLGPRAIGDQPQGSNPKAYLAEKAYRKVARVSSCVGPFAGSTAGSFDLNLSLDLRPSREMFSKRWRLNGY